jgi:molecular chaperone GrpE
MSTRPRKPTDLPEPERPAKDDGEEPIEIIEVVGVDETTGTVREKSGGKDSATERHTGRRHRDSGSRSQDHDELLREKDKYYDLLLRKQADFDNYRKRMERERAEFGSAATGEVLKRLLPVLDNMERALRASEGSKDPLFKGIELVHQQFLDLLKKEGVVPIEAIGSRFDPRLHEAVDVLDIPGLEADLVLEEMQKGYTYNDKLLRPALVKVASRKGTERSSSPAPRGGDSLDEGDES